MKVQLVLPKCDNPGARLIRGWPQPLGILSIATFLRQQNPTIEIEILDGTVLSHKEIERRIDGDVVGITTITRGYPNALKVAEKAKRFGAKVVLGGQYATALGSTILKNRPFVDAIIRYDGEVAFTKYVDGVPLDEIENLVYRQPDGTFRENPIKLVDIDALPIPDRSFLDLTPYDENYAKYVGGPFERAGTIYAHRGCRWRAELHGGCVFCAIPDHTWRLRTSENFWQEVQQLAESGFEFLYDISDDIAADKDWLRELRRTRPPVRMCFRHYLSTKNTDEETIETLLEIGSVHVFVGFESADPERLSSMNKEATVEENENAARVLQQYGMPLLASFVGGVPGETRESLDRTMEFTRYVSELPVTAGIHWDVLKPVPGSRAFQMMLEYPDLGPKYQGKDTFDLEEMKVDWVRTFCEVDYEYLCSVEEEAEKLMPDTATYAPLDEPARGHPSDSDSV